jgi:hemerythrin-like metal-binding protein
MNEKVWEDFYNTGISRMDKQNREIVENIYNLVYEIKHDENEYEHFTEFRNIIFLLTEHWIIEENLMEHFHYERFKIHLEGHNRFWNILKKLYSHFENRTYYDHIDLFKDLREEYLNHIDFEDKKFAGFMNEKGHEKLHYF